MIFDKTTTQRVTIVGRYRSKHLEAQPDGSFDRSKEWHCCRVRYEEGHPYGYANLLERDEHPENLVATGGPAEIRAAILAAPVIP